MGCLFLSIGLSTTQGTRGPGEVLRGVMLTQAGLTLRPKYYGSFYKAKNPREFSSIKNTWPLTKENARNTAVRALSFRCEEISGELGRLIIDSLRRSETPQSTKEAVAAVTAAIGQEQASELLMASTVRGCLGYLTRRGSVMQIGKGTGTTWRLTQTAPQPEQRN